MKTYMFNSNEIKLKSSSPSNRVSMISTSNFHVHLKHTVSVIINGVNDSNVSYFYGFNSGIYTEFSGETHVLSVGIGLFEKLIYLRIPIKS